MCITIGHWDLLVVIRVFGNLQKVSLKDNPLGLIVIFSFKFALKCAFLKGPKVTC